MMIRYLASLGVFLVLSLWFLAADHGPNSAAPRQPTAAAAVQPPGRAVFVPAQPIMQTPTVVAASPPAPAPEALPVALPVPEVVAVSEATRLMQAPGGASVRSGPGPEFAVVGSLAPGAVVQVIDATSAPGWVRITVAGLGEAWVGARLLR